MIKDLHAVKLVRSCTDECTFLPGRGFKPYRGTEEETTLHCVYIFRHVVKQDLLSITGIGGDHILTTLSRNHMSSPCDQ